MCDPGDNESAMVRCDGGMSDASEPTPPAAGTRFGAFSYEPLPLEAPPEFFEDDGDGGFTVRGIQVGLGPLGVDDVVAVARYDAPIVLTEDASAEVARSRRIIDDLANDTVPHYGISTGFGALATTSIPLDKRQLLQRSLVASHAAGSGEPVEREVVRALMLLRISTLATGRTGIRPETLEAYVAMLNAGITPVVREYGSLGCSGDLAPLAHCALALMGDGEVTDAEGHLTNAENALRAAGIEPVVLQEKEGLPLINGTDGMLGMLCLAIADLRMLLTTADVAAGLSVEGLPRVGRRLRRRPAATASAPGPGAQRRQSAQGARRQRNPRLAPRQACVHPRAGRLLAAMFAAGDRCCARHPRSRHGRHQPRAGGRRR